MAASSLTMPPIALLGEDRIELGLQCRDCDVIPKVEDAGRIVEDLHGRRVQLMHNGLKVVADGYYGTVISELIRRSRGHHEGQEERIFHELVSRLPTTGAIMELGGHWSYYSLWFLLGGGDRRAVILEPEPQHRAIGEANAVLNDLHPLFFSGFASGEHQDRATFVTEASGTVEMTGYTVASLMAASGLERLSILHCDIQGAEADVLESSRDLFRQGRIDWVFVSTHAHHISGDPLTHERCLQILREEGAVIEAEHDVYESFSGDGLIVARFGHPPAGWKPVALSRCRATGALFRSLAYDLAEAQQEIKRLRSEADARAATVA